MRNKWFILLLLLLPQISRAGLILGTHLGQTYDDGKGIEKLKGSSLGFKTGWRWNYLAFELDYTQFDMKTKPGQSDDFYVEKALLKASSIDLAFRFYLFSFFSLVFGTSVVDSDGNIKLTNIGGDSSMSYEETGSLYTSGSFIGAAIHIPLKNGFQVYAEYLRRRWKPLSTGLETYTPPDLLLHEWRAGIAWEWGGGSRTSGKSSKKD